jgi:hypothetical protein
VSMATHMSRYRYDDRRFLYFHLFVLLGLVNPIIETENQSIYKNVVNCCSFAFGLPQNGKYDGDSSYFINNYLSICHFA